MTGAGSGVMAAALGMVEFAWPCFPCSPTDKSPLVKDGFKAATIDSVQIMDWWSEWPHALIGVPTGADTSGYDVLDVDTYKRPETKAWLEANKHRIPHTLTRTTRSGGLHFLFRSRPGLRCSAGTLAPGVDVRATGGYVVDWHAMGLPLEHDAPIAEWPEWLLFDLVRRQTTEAGPVDAASLAPPSADAVVALLERMPNPENASRDVYVKVMEAARGCELGLEALGTPDTEGAIAEAAATWAERWEGTPLNGERTDERAKWERDWGTHTDVRSGWRHLQGVASTLIPEYGAEVAAEDFAGASLSEKPQDPPRPDAAERKLRVLTPTDCAAAPRRGYLVKGLIAPRDLCIVAGEPGAGKSVICPHVGYAVAQGRPVFGRRVKAGTVLYVSAEDPHGMAQRVTALRVEHGDASNFLVVPDVSDLFGTRHADAGPLLDLVDEHKPALVIVDTVAAAAPGIRENESEDMSRVFGLARRIARRGPAVILAHHVPKGGSTPRGHGNLHGDADVTLMLASDENGCTWGTLTKNRNGPSGRFAGFKIKPVAIGTDEDGDPITAPIADEAIGDRRAADKLPPAAAAALNVLRELARDSGATMPDGRVTVAEDAWRAACDDRRVSTADTPKNRRDAIQRTFRDLRSMGRIAFGDGRAWEVGAVEIPFTDLVGGT